MDKRKKLLVVLVIILSILIVGTGGYIVYDKVLKDDNVSENNDNTLVNYTEEEILEILNGKWLDCSKKSEDVDCNSIIVSKEDNYFTSMVSNTEDRADFGVYDAKIIETKKDGNYFNITVKETDDIEETEYTRYIKLDISKLSERVIKIEAVDNKEINSSNYYHAGSDYDKNNKYIEEQKLNVDSETIKKLKSTFEFVYDYLDSTHPFCGESTDEGYFTVEGTEISYRKSTQFKSYNELLDYLKKYMSKEIINNNKYYSMTDIVKELDIYKEKDNNLYCLYDITKGGGYYEIDEILITANNIDENKISSKVEVKLSWWYAIWYEYYNVTYTKINDNWVITSYELRG